MRDRRSIPLRYRLSLINIAQEQNICLKKSGRIDYKKPLLCKHILNFSSIKPIRYSENGQEKLNLETIKANKPKKENDLVNLSKKKLQGVPSVGKTFLQEQFKMMV